MTRLPTPIYILASLLSLYLVAPLLAGLANVGTADWAGAEITGLLRASVVSIASATAATALVTLGGVPLAYLLARRPTRPLAVLGFVVQLPLALPPLSSGILLLFLLGYSSPLGRLAGGGLTDSFIGVVLAEAFVAAPFLIIAARSAFADVDPLLEDVVATLGHKPGAVFRHVSLALAWRAILSGMLLTWLRAFGEFGATVMVAYHPLSLPVYTYVAFGSRGLPAMLPVLLPTIFAAVGVMVLSRVAVMPKRRAVRPVPLQPLHRQPYAPEVSSGPSFSIAMRDRVGDFTLEVVWHTNVRRLAILGASGSGKSLTLRRIAGLGGVATNRVVFDGRDLGRLPPEARDIAYVPQTYGLLPDLTVADQIRLATDCDPALASLWTERLGLATLTGRRSLDLSIGQRQRVALARALSRGSASLILLDEPFAALDTPLRTRLQDELLALQHELAATTIVVTHDPAEAILLADELLLLDEGRVLQSGPVDLVFARPANRLAAELLGARVMGEGRVVGENTIDIGRGVTLSVAGPALTPGTRVGWAIRSPQMRFVHDEGYPAVLTRLGPVTDGRRLVTARIGDVTLTFHSDPRCPPVGDCRLAMDPGAIQVWSEAE